MCLGHNPKDYEAPPEGAPDNDQRQWGCLLGVVPSFTRMKLNAINNL